MRILFITNFYPPVELGGQGRSCQQVVEGLARRGHKTLVLTSSHRAASVTHHEHGIERTLYLEMELGPALQPVIFFTARHRRERENLDRLNDLLESFRPDLVFIWGMWNLPWSIPALAEKKMPGRTIYRFAEYWPTLPSQHEMYWRKTGRSALSRIPKSLLGALALWMINRDKPRPTLKFRHSVCVSSATRDVLLEAGINIQDAKIIHTGIDLVPYRDGKRQQDPSLPGSNILRLVYAGRLTKEKGVDTALEAIKSTMSQSPPPEVTLTIIGRGSQAFEDQLKRFIEDNDLGRRVELVGQLAPEKMPAMLAKFDVLIVPSVWDEPFARIVLEGMAAGLVVLATPIGGTSEIIVDGVNGLLFNPGDANDLAEKIRTLYASEALRAKLSRAGTAIVESDYSELAMLENYESLLKQIVGENPMPEPTVDDLTAEVSGAQQPHG